MSNRPHLLLVGDFCVRSGFARVNEAIAAGLTERGWKVSVLAIGYAGDPNPLQRQYMLYPASANSGDGYGYRRLPLVLNAVQPDAVLLVNDPWIVDDYLAILSDVPNLPPCAAYMPVDGPNLNPARLLNLAKLDLPIAYTRFGANELVKAGLSAPIPAIPHGIDLTTFYPSDKRQARASLGMPDGFVVLLCDSNSGRKRLDIAIQAFAQFASRTPNAYLLIHSQEQSEWGWDLGWLCHKAGIADRVIMTGKHGRLTDSALRLVYASADVFITATMGEGWGFGSAEAMACGVPVLASRYAALGEWADGAALLVDCDPELSHTYAMGCNHEGGVVRPSVLADALSILYHDPAEYEHCREMGLLRVQQPIYRWENIADKFDVQLRTMIGRETFASYELASSEVTG